MSLYLLHIDPRFKHAAHYLGFTPDADVTRRVTEHMAGGSKASPLIKAALNVGCSITVVRTWTDETANRTKERRIKDTKRIPDYCPICRKLRRRSKQTELPL